MRRSGTVGVLFVLCALVLAACGGAPTSGPAEGETAGGAQPGGGGSDAAVPGGGLDEVLAEVEGLEGEPRTQRLAELARDAGGSVNLYTSLTSELSDRVSSAFSDQYGLDVEVYRASSESILQRLLQEVEAGRSGADLVEANGQDLVVYSREGALQPYDSPERENLVDEALFEDWTGTRFQVFAPAWNAMLVGDPPGSWEELADPAWDGRMAMETGNADWYMALSDHWAEQGKSEQEIQQLWQDMAEGTLMVSGHSTMRELLIGGEFDAVATLYSYMTEESAAAGAPLEWQPTVSPLIVRTNGAGVVQNASNPAGAMLLMDWLLSREGQQLFVDVKVDPVREDMVDFGDAELYEVDLERFVDDIEQLLDEFEQLTRLGEQGPEG